MMRPAPTVPGGDTPCLTAGDARRANPWRSGEGGNPTSDTRGVAQQPLLLTHLFTPSTLSVRRRRRRRSLSTHLHGFTLATARASPAVKHGAPPPEA